MRGGVLHASTAAGPVAVVEVEAFALQDEGADAVLGGCVSPFLLITEWRTIRDILGLLSPFLALEEALWLLVYWPVEHPANDQVNAAMFEVLALTSAAKERLRARAPFLRHHQQRRPHCLLRDTIDTRSLTTDSESYLRAIQYRHLHSRQDNTHLCASHLRRTVACRDLTTLHISTLQ